MKSLIFLVVALLATGAYAGSITGVSTSTSAPNSGGYLFDDFAIGNESRNILWNDAAETPWDNGHRDVAQFFTLDTAQALGGFSFRLDPRGGESAFYMPSEGRDLQITLYQVGSSNYDLNYGTALTSWTGHVTNALNGPAANSWINFTFGQSYNLNAGVSYALQVGMTEKSGTDKWGGFISYGIFDPEAFPGQWAVYTGSAGTAEPPQTYYKTWRSGRFELVPTPEPATLALLGLGGLLLRRKSK